MLTEIAINNAKPKEKPYKLFDGNGLFLLVTPTGFKSWRYKYRFNKKERLLTFGKFKKNGSKSAGFTLKDARKEHAIAYGLIQQGIDPAIKKKESKAEQLVKKEAEQPPQGKTFREVAILWAEYKTLLNTKGSWKEGHKLAVIRSLDKYVMPLIGDKIIHTLVSSDINDVLNPIKERGTYEVLGRTAGRIDRIFRYGMNEEYCTANPASGKAEHLPTRKVKNMAYVKEKELPLFLNDLENYTGNIICKTAVQFALLTHVRTKELRFTEWAEIDLEAKLWHIPAHRMKMKISQTIPLPDQAIELLERVKPITGECKHVFASLQAMSKPISENGMLSVIYNMNWKGKTTVHGLARSTFSTIGNETLKFRSDAIEAALAHAVKDPVRGAYNHATYLEERTEHSQIWADYLDKLKKGADIVPIKKVG